jgi:hypothetical protein
MTDTEVALVLPKRGALALLDRDGQAARDYARESLSPATRRAHQTDVDAFVTWCRGQSVQALPAEPEVAAAKALDRTVTANRGSTDRVRRAAPER